MRLTGDHSEHSQSGGPGSINVQAGRDVVHTGLSYEDARQIAQDTVLANLFVFRAEAELVVKARVREISEIFVERMRSELPEALESLKDPDVQFSLITVGRDYARTGDKEMGDVLVDLLARRCVAETRTLMAVILNDAITTAPRLTSSELAILTLGWKLHRTKSLNISKFDDFQQYIADSIEPYVRDIPTGEAPYLHLQYLGCASVNTLQGGGLIDHWLTLYSGVFVTGFRDDEVPEELRPLLSNTQIFIPCLRDRAKFQVNAIDDDAIRKVAGIVGKPEIADALVTLQRGHLMPADQVRAELIAANPCMERLLFVFEETHLRHLMLTSVGMAIAHANDRRVTGQGAPLSIWVSDDAPAS